MSLFTELTDRYVRSEIGQSSDWNEQFDLIKEALNGGAATGLTAAQNLNTAPTGIKGSNFENNTLLTAHFPDNTITGTAKFEAKAIQDRHLKFGGTNDPIAVAKLLLTPDTADSIPCLTIENAAPTTHHHVIAAAAAGPIRILTGYNSFTRTVSFSDSDFGDPGFAEAPVIHAWYSHEPGGDNWLTGLQPLGDRIYDFDANGFHCISLFNNESGAEIELNFCWYAIGRKAL